MLGSTFDEPIRRLLDWPLWRSTLFLSIAAVAVSGINGMIIIYLLVGVLEPTAIMLAFFIPGVVVPPAAMLQLWGLRRAHRSERELARFFATTGALLAIGNFSGRFTRLSPSWERVLGYSPAEMSAVRFNEFIHPDDLERTTRELALLASGRHQTKAFVHRFRHKHGGFCWLQWNATSDVRRKLIYATAVDITARVEAEAFKDSLISTVNHEIRTPLASLFAALKIATGMQDNQLPPQTSRMLNIAESNAERLVRIIDDMLDLERIQTGNVEYRLAPRSAEALVESAADQARFLFEEAEVELEVFDDSRGRRIEVDELRLQQVLGNLLSNAAKFAPTGSTVRLSAEIDGDGDSVRFRVSDRGPGVLPGDRERVFERFYQSPAHDKGGSGLGLAICKTLVEGMGGEIGIEPDHGGGATFFVRFPFLPEVGNLAALHPEPASAD